MKNQTVTTFRALLNVPHALQACQQAALATVREEASAVLLPKLQEAFPEKPEADLASLDFNLLSSLLTKDFGGQTLTHLDLSDLPLDEANFSEASLHHVNLSASRLREANFSGAVLNDVELKRADAQSSTWEGVCLHGVDFSHARLAGARFQIEPSTPALTGPQLDFEQADLSHANFQDSSLQEARFVQAHMPHCSFSGVDLTDANFEQADLFASEGCDLTATNANFCSAFLSCARWPYARLQRANFTEACLAQTDLSYAQLSGALLVRADLQQANLSRASAQHADFSYANLVRANLRSSQLDHAVMLETLCYGTGFNSTSTTGTFFGYSLKYDQDTIIPTSSHDLISMLLLTQASTWEEKQFAAAIRVTPHWCWKEFVRQIKTSPDLIAWARRALSAVQSLRQEVAAYERLIQKDDPHTAAQPTIENAVDDSDEQPF